MLKSCIFALLSFACVSVHAIDVPPAVTLEDVLELARENNPILQAERQRIVAARADIASAAALPNPEITYNRLRGEREAMVEQPVPIFGQRALRRESAQLDLNAVSAEIDAEAHALAHDTALTFSELLVAQERLKVWDEVLESINSAIRIVRGQVDAGVRSQYDLARIELENEQLVVERAQAASDVLQTAARLAAFVGLPEWRPVALGELQPTADGRDFGSLWPRTLASLPMLRAALAETVAADKRIELSRREAWPTPSIGVGQLREPDGRRTIYGIAIEVPLFDRQQGPVARARAEAAQARMRRTAYIVEAESLLRQRTERLVGLVRLTEDFERQGLARLPAMRQMAEDAYTLGQGGILDLIDSIHALAEKRLAYLDLVGQALEAEMDVLSLTGDFHR